MHNGRKEGLPSASRKGTRKSMVGKLMPRYSAQVVYGLRAYGFSTSTWRMAVATAGSISAQADAALRRSCTSCRAGGMSSREPARAAWLTGHISQEQEHTAEH